MLAHRIVAVIGMLGLLSAAPAHADEICVPLNGSSRTLRVRPACKPREHRVGSLASFERLLTALSAEDDGTTLRFTGVNLQIVSGSGSTAGPTNGLGNLIVGYDEQPTVVDGDSRAGSHNVVVGTMHRYASFGGLVVGRANSIAAPFATVCGGSENEALAEVSSVSGGASNRATGYAASVSGGAGNLASGDSAAVSGGVANKATAGFATSVSGGAGNLASGLATSVSGGNLNVAGCADESFCGSGEWAAVAGGTQNAALGASAWIGGGQLNRVAKISSGGAISGGLSNQVTGSWSSVHGGQNNVAGPSGVPTEVVGEPFVTKSATVCGGRANRARGQFSSISGGAALELTSEDGWAAGSLGAGGSFNGMHRSE